MSELELTPSNGIRIDVLQRARADVEYLGSRVWARVPRILDNSIGIDSMSFIQETPEDQMAAYAFSKYWVWRVI